MFKKYKSGQAGEKPEKKRVPPEFGEDIRNQEFVMDPEFAFMNNASRGVTPKQVLEEAQRKTIQFELNTEWYYKYDKSPELQAALQILATFINTQATDLSFVENTTRGLNNIIKTVDFAPGQAILQNNLTYLAVKNMHKVVAKEKGVEILEIQHIPPVNSAEEIVQQYRDMFAAHNNIRLATVDHISSKPPILFPVREIIEVCHENNVLVLVDGGHAVGQIPVDLTELGMDFYAGNTNKWAFGAKNCAFQYVAPALHDMSGPVVTSEKHDDPFPDNMFTQGSRNDAAYLAYPVAHEFYTWIGGLEALTAYNVPLLEQGLDLLQEAWHTERYPIAKELEVPFMRVLTIPDTLAYPKNKDGASRMTHDLINRFQIMIGIDYSRGELMTRLSSQVYVVLNDFVRLRDAVMILKDEEPDNPKQLANKAKPQ